MAQINLLMDPTDQQKHQSTIQKLAPPIKLVKTEDLPKQNHTNNSKSMTP